MVAVLEAAAGAGGLRWFPTCSGRPVRTWRLRLPSIPAPCLEREESMIISGRPGCELIISQRRNMLTSSLMDITRAPCSFAFDWIIQQQRRRRRGAEIYDSTRRQNSFFSLFYDDECNKRPPSFMWCRELYQATWTNENISGVKSASDYFPSFCSATWCRQYPSLAQVSSPKFLAVAVNRRRRRVFMLKAFYSVVTLCWMRRRSLSRKTLFVVSFIIKKKEAQETIEMS